MVGITGWLEKYQYVAIWLEGFALVAIFWLDWLVRKDQREDRREQHKETLAQLQASQQQIEAMVNSERAWIVVELIPRAVRYSDKQWHRFVGGGHVLMSENEILAGDHLKYKLKFTNMGRTPAQIFGFTLDYSLLGEGVTDLPESGGGDKVQKSYRAFEHWLAGDGKGIEIEEPILDVDSYISNDKKDITALKKTAVFHGWVKYRHVFSTTEVWYSDFCSVFTVSEQRLTTVGRRTKQRQEKATGPLTFTSASVERTNE